MFVSFPQDYVDHAIIAITYIIKHEDMIMINQSTKEKGRWAAARIFGTLYRLNPKHMDEWIRKQKLANVSKYPLSRQGGSSSSGSSSGSGGSRRVAPPIRQDMFLVPIHR